MTDKEKILAKIELLLNEMNYEPYTEEVLGRIQSLKELKSYIESMQDEPCNHCQGHNNKEECDTLVFEHNCPIVKKPVSNDLEEAAIAYNKKAVIAHNKKVNFVVAGNIPNEHFIAGAKWQEQQMMSKAINAQCFGFQGAALFSFRLPADNYLVGSEIKVIVIKED